MSTIYAFKVDKITMGKLHQNIVKTGYISNLRYRDKFQFNPEVGVRERQDLLKMVEVALDSIDYDSYVLFHKIKRRGNNYTLEMELIDQTLRVNFDTINSIVSQNKDRKINQKCFLPFDKGMDKYNSLYVSVETSNLTDDTYEAAERIIGKIMSNMNLPKNLYYFKSMVIRNPIAV